MTFFCPLCWKEIKAIDRICPCCGADISGYKKRDFEKKLIHALRHTEPKITQQAVYILGRLKSIRAVKSLIKLFKQTDDALLKMKILDSLSEIGTPEVRNFIIKVLLQAWHS